VLCSASKSRLWPRGLPICTQMQGP
jgi:hypothetical protein